MDGSTPAGSTPAGATPPWTEWPLGARVVVRRRLAEGGLGDVLGELLVSSPDGVVVRTRRGDVTVDAGDVVLGKVVPAAPPPRRPRSCGTPRD